MMMTRDIGEGPKFSLGVLTMHSLCGATMVPENEAKIKHHAGHKFQYVPNILCVVFELYLYLVLYFCNYIVLGEKLDQNWTSCWP